MMDKTYFRVFSGLLTGEHRKKLSSSIWTYLWMLDRITNEVTDKDSGEVVGNVMYHNITTFAEIASDLGMSRSTVQEQCSRLEKEGYIKMICTPRGNRFSVLRSKKWGQVTEVSMVDDSKNEVLRSENTTNFEEDRSENRTKCPENRTTHRENRTNSENGRSENRTKCTENRTTHRENRTERTESRTLCTENPMSNTNNKKELLNNTTTNLSSNNDSSEFLINEEPDDVDKLVNHFLVLIKRLNPTTKDYQAAGSILAIKDMSIDKAIKLLDAAYEKATANGKDVKALAYLAPIVSDLNGIELAKEKAKHDPKPIQTYEFNYKGRRNQRVAPLPKFLQEDEKQSNPHQEEQTKKELAELMAQREERRRVANNGSQNK